MRRFYSRKPYYDDDSDYTTNAPSYYDDLARKNKLIKVLAERIGYYDEELAKRFEEWDKNLEKLPNELKRMFLEWVDDGTLARILAQLLLDEYATKDYVTNELNDFKTFINNELDNYKNTVNEILEDFSNDINDIDKKMDQFKIDIDNEMLILKDLMDKKIKEMQVKSDGSVYQTLLTELNTGTVEQPIFEGAEHAPQGLAYIDHEGEKKVFMVTRVTGGSWSLEEYSRITEFRLREDGKISNHITYSNLLQIGHQGISAFTENNELYFITGATTGNSPNTVKGFSKVKWRGGDTSQQDVESFQVIGENHTDHVLKDFYNATPCVSKDGKYVVMAVSASYDTGLRYCIVFDRLQVENATNPLNVNPLKVFKIIPPTQNNSHIVQDIACDGVRIYIFTGYTGVPSAKVINVYTLNGRFLGHYTVEGSMGDYTIDQLKNGNGVLGNAINFEPEGIDIKDNNLLILTSDVWQREEVYTRRIQKIHEISNVRKQNSTPIDRGLMPIEPSSSMHLYGSSVDLSIPDGTAFNVSYWDEDNRSFKNMMSVNGMNSFHLYDGRTSEYNDHFTSINTFRDERRQYTEMRSNVNIAGGAGFSMYGKEDEVARGNFIIYALGTNDENYNVRLQETGAWRGSTNGEQNLGTNQYPWANIYSTGGVHEPSDERLKQDIEDIPEVVLKAWSEVNYKQFRFKKAVNEKGENARKHIGVIAQQIQNVFKKYGLNAFDYGLLGYNEWEEQEEQIDHDENGKPFIIQEKREAGNVLSIRANECLFLESALMRWELNQIKRMIKSDKNETN